jgi:tol-pal system protein YbgF
MSRVKKIFIAGCSVFLLCQCAAKDEVRDLSYQIRTVNKKVDEMRGTTVDQMQKKQASSFSRIDEVNDELLQIRSSLEENALLQSRAREQSKETIAALQARINTLQEENSQALKNLESKIQQISSDVESLRQDRIRDAEKRVRDAARQAEEARKRTVQAATSEVGSGAVKVEPQKRKEKVEGSKRNSAPEASEKPVVVASPVQKNGSDKAPIEKAPQQAVDLFSKGMDVFKSNKYKEAYAVFEEVLAGNPRGDRAAETLFFMGESLFNQGEYDLAILDYQKVISNHPKHAKKPAALLKQGMSFEKLTDLETAKIIYKKLVAEHPASSEAKTANARLEKL